MEITPLAFGLALMIQAAPPERLAALPAYPGWQETGEERRARYVEIEAAARRVAFDSREMPLYRGPRGRALTEINMLAFAGHESGFQPDADRGPCYPVKDIKTGIVRCDGGTSACLMQIKIGAGTTDEGWTQAELFADREKCFRAGLHKIRRAMKACVGKVAPEDIYSAYASGTCATSKAGRDLFGWVKAWTTRAAPLPLDADVAKGGAPTAWHPSVRTVGAR